MKYRVRTPDGELEYESFKQLEEAARLGFVDPNDELLREGETEWKKVSSQPSLVKHRGGTALLKDPMYRWIGLAVAGAVFAFWAIQRGHANDQPELYAGGLVVAFLTVGVLWKVTTDAQRRRH